MYIRRGHLYRDGSHLTYFGLVPPDLEFQLTDEAGNPVTGDYIGPGSDKGERVILGDYTDPCAFLTIYLVSATPTPESDGYLEGWFLAMRQARRTPPKDEAQRLGWQVGCRSIDDFPEVKRRQRRKALKNAGARPTHETFVREMLFAW